MQTTSASQNHRMCGFAPAREGRTAAFLRAAAASACVVAMAILMLWATPDPAFARSYTMPRVDISAQAETDGSLQVTERRTFDFDGSFTAVWWAFEGLPDNADLQINSVRMAVLDAEGQPVGEVEPLEAVPFVVDWREAGGPGKTSYSFDAPKDTVYVFFDVSSARMLIELDYTVENGVQAYRDVGEVYWKYVGDQWAVPSENISMTLALPVPSDTEVTPGDNVRAWGHGPLDGKVSIHEDGSVAYEVAKVNAGQYAEARIVFPVSWLTNLSSESRQEHQGVMRLDKVLSEEQGWADQANRSRILSLLLIAGSLVVCVLAVVWALRQYFRYGKEHAPDFTGEYWRDVPDPSTHPALIGRLWRWDRQSQDDFTATLMRLSHIGALRIDKGSYLDADGREVVDYYLTRMPAVADQVADPIDKAALDTLFGEVAQGRDSLWFGSIEQYGKDHPQQFLDAMSAWQGVVSAETNSRDFFEMKSKRYQRRLVFAAVGLVLASGAVWYYLQNFIPLIFAVPTAIAIGVIANYMPRRSVEGNNIVARCKALRNWLRDFSLLDERPPTDVKVWGEFMVYAYLFGIADRVMKELRTRIPEAMDADAYAGSAISPWWLWYAPSYGASGGSYPAAGNLFDTAWANTESSARAALSALSGGDGGGFGGGFSSGGGFGGGFSGGGGGGFGGGGGAR